MGERPRVVVFGMRGVGSLPVLREVMAAGYDVRAVMMPGPPGSRTLPPLLGKRSLLPMAGAGNEPVHIDDLARREGIPVLLVGSLRRAEVAAVIATFEPDVIAVSCFPLRVPSAILQLPRLGCLNIHPSLLPVGRGPEPVFWTLRRGESMTGVTVHVMDQGFDSGPIVLQERVPVPVDVRLPAFERALAERGARLLVQAVAGLSCGVIAPVPQAHDLATTAPMPTGNDFLIPTDRDAEWAYRFARAVAPLQGPLAVLDVRTGKRIAVSDAIDWTRDRCIESQQPIDSATIAVQFRTGSVRFLRARKEVTQE